MIIIMNLDVKPTLKNVEQLKAYVNDLPDKSPYKLLPNYEQHLVDTNKSVRALARICEGVHHVLINKLENLTNVNWFRVSNITDPKVIPDNYFDIVLWSDCDLESELHQINQIYPKLKQGGRIYFDNLLKDFDKILKSCLVPKDISKLLGKKLTPSFKHSHDYVSLVQNILQYIFNHANPSMKYLVRIIDHGEDHYIVIVKGDLLKFEPDVDLEGAIADVNKTIKQKFPLETEIYISQI